MLLAWCSYDITNSMSIGFLSSRVTASSSCIQGAGVQGASGVPKKQKGNRQWERNKGHKGQEKQAKSKKRPTDSLPFLKAPLASAVEIPPHVGMWAPAASGCGVFLCEVVPSDGSFMWCLCETLRFAAIFFFKRTLFLFPPKNKLIP
jgi:hypothetical protein